MKKMSLLVMLAAVALLAGCQDAQKDAELAGCQQEKLDLQSQLDQANATVQQKDQKIEAMKGEITKLNQTALESITTMMQKQNAKDVELKNKLKAKEIEAGGLQKTVQELKAQLNAAKAAAKTVETAAEAATDAVKK